MVFSLHQFLCYSCNFTKFLKYFLKTLTDRIQSVVNPFWNIMNEHFSLFSYRWFYFFTFNKISRLAAPTYFTTNDWFQAVFLFTASIIGGDSILSINRWQFVINHSVRTQKSRHIWHQRSSQIVRMLNGGCILNFPCIFKWFLSCLFNFEFWFNSSPCADSVF